VGVAIGLVQSITQLQEQTLTFVPKFVATGVVIIVAGSWMLNEMVFFTQELLDMVPDLVH
jgi:flagellar biosynthetic protein FliQ